MNKKVGIGFRASFFCSLLLSKMWAKKIQEIKYGANLKRDSYCDQASAPPNAERCRLDAVIQEESSQFPQSPSVYDLQGEELTIVKQYHAYDRK